MQAWEEFLAEQEKKFGETTVQKWLRSLKILQFDAGNLYLEAEDSFQCHWFEEHIRPLLPLLKNNNNRPIQVHLAPAQKKQEKKKNSFFSPANVSFCLQPDFLDPQKSFENFLPFTANTMAQKLLFELPNLSFNPIYIYGNSGGGKTHLLMAAAQALKKMGKNVFFVTAETFTDHVVNSMRQGNMQGLRKIYRNVDAFILDDIHLFSRKTATQEEFFHTFNALHTKGSQILLSANCAPHLLVAVEARLVSRFEWGICIPLQDLKKEEILMILEKKTQMMGLSFTENALALLMESFAWNLKKIDRALQAFQLRTTLPSSTKIEAPYLSSLLSDLLEEEKKNLLHFDKILGSVANYYGIRMEDILGKSRSRESSLPRQVAMFLCREKLHLPYIKIGELFDRDHSTVMTSIKTIKKTKATNKDLIGALVEIAQQLHA